MSRKRYTPEQIIGKLREAKVALSALYQLLTVKLAGTICFGYIKVTVSFQLCQTESGLPD